MTSSEARTRLAAATRRRTILRRLPTSSPVELNTARDVVTLLGEQLNEIREDPHIEGVERARLVAGLCTVALRAIEQAEGDERLKAIQRVLQERAAAEKRRQADGDS